MATCFTSICTIMYVAWHLDWIMQALKIDRLFPHSILYLLCFQIVIDFLRHREKQCVSQKLVQCPSDMCPLSVQCVSHVHSVPFLSRVHPLSILFMSCVQPYSTLIPCDVYLVSFLCPSCLSSLSVLCPSCVCPMSFPFQSDVPPLFVQGLFCVHLLSALSPCNVHHVKVHPLMVPCRAHICPLYIPVHPMSIMH